MHARKRDAAVALEHQDLKRTVAAGVIAQEDDRARRQRLDGFTSDTPRTVASAPGVVHRTPLDPAGAHRKITAIR